MHPPDTLRNNRILIIDDNPSIHEDIRKILGGWGEQHQDLNASKALLFGDAIPESQETQFELDSAYQGSEGLNMVRQAAEVGRPYAVAFVDVRMPPGWDGVETISRIWKIQPTLQVVVCTAYSDYSWAEMIRQIGKSDGLLILKKPFDNIEVVQLAHALTEKWLLGCQVRGRLHDLDQQVRQRTTELQLANEQLNKEIAEQRAMEQQLRQAQKMEAVGQLAAGVAHDFNNVLTVIQGHASMLLASRPPESGDRKPLEAITVAAERAGKLVRQLLTFSRKQFVKMSPMDVGRTLSSISDMLHRVLPEDIKVTINVAPGLPQINADAGMIEQMLMNLVVNARDAMPAGGPLAISWELVEVSSALACRHPDARPGRFLCLTVTDAGCGIAPDVLSHIFEPFYTTKPVGKGTGLGLSTVHGIVKQHEGWIEVSSLVGRGATFKVFLPSHDTAPASLAQTDAQSNVALQHGKGETILVVEDEPAVRELACMALKQYGYQVLKAIDGPQALELWECHPKPIDLLLTDMVMPNGMSGGELAQQLRSRNEKLKVLFSSGYSSEITGEDSLLAQGGSFLPKPYSLHELIQAVQSSLGVVAPAEPVRVVPASLAASARRSQAIEGT